MGSLIESQTLGRAPHSMIVTVQQHIVQQQESLYPGARGTFSWLLSGITLATKMIQARIRRAGLLDVAGSAGGTNVQGEVQQKLDVYANEALLHCLGVRDAVAVLVSEENEEPVTFDRAPETGKYVVIFDPLDGSSNIDVNVSVGTIFSIFRRPDNAGSRPEISRATARLQTSGGGIRGLWSLHGVCLYRRPWRLRLHSRSQYRRVRAEPRRHPDARQGKYYSVNEANAQDFPDEYQEYLARLRGGALGWKYSSRYIGSLVADFHRTLLKGGVFLYPPTKTHANGKLRLLYEANPLAFIAEQAGGAATNGTRRIIDIQPEESTSALRWWSAAASKWKISSASWATMSALPPRRL